MPKSKISSCCARTGLPTYQLGVVVDDMDMRITHVIRGADHLSNTPKQALLYQALGATPPIFAHVPLILGPDRTRLSKRHGATSVGSYTEEGFLPEAFRNFLALLGWSTGDDTEFLRTPELVERFSLAGVSRTNAIFDRAKLEWFNQQYLHNLPVGELLPYVEAELRRAGIWRDEWGGSERGWIERTVDLIRPRTRFVNDFSGWARAFFSDEFEYDPEAREKFWKDERLPALLRQARRCACRSTRLESRCLRSCSARNCRCRRGKSRPADQCDPRGDCGPRGGSAVIRFHACDWERTRGRTIAPRPSGPFRALTD